MYNTKKCLTYISKSHEDDVDFFHLENNKSRLPLFLLLGGEDSVGLSDLSLCNISGFIHYELYTVSR